MLEVVLAEQVDHLFGVLVAFNLLVNHHVDLLLELHQLALLLVIRETSRRPISTVLHVVVHLLLGNLNRVAVSALLLLLLALLFVRCLSIAGIVAVVRLLASWPG